MKFSSISLYLTIFGFLQSPPVFADSSSDDGVSVDTVRFNKFGILDETFEDLPLMPDSYPISANEDVFQFLQFGTDAESVVNSADDHEVIYDIEELIDVVGGPPDHPSSNFDAPYWDKLNRVINMRNIRGSRKAAQALSEELRLPLRWRSFTVDDVAQAVYDEVS